MHWGTAPVVQKKKQVQEGDLIASLGPGAPIHSSVTGMVKTIESRSHLTMVCCDAVIVDRTSKPPALQAEDWRKLPESNCSRG
jgi:Na+-translocating ferredoxin:NAD+ oxidoreductase RnfC subunit